MVVLQKYFTKAGRKGRRGKGWERGRMEKESFVHSRKKPEHNMQINKIIVVGAEKAL